MTKKWTEKDDELIRRLYPTCRLDSLAFRLGVTYGALKCRAQKLGVTRTVHVKRQWTHRQMRYLINHYADTPMDVLVQKHRWVWEQAHGKIPKGYIIAFRDGNKQNCALENLQMMSLYENGLRHLRDETPEKRKERMAKINASRKEHIRRERIRIHYGLEPLGGLVKKW